MNVGGEGEGGRVVAEPELNLLRVQTRAEEACAAGVAERVRADPRDACALARGPDEAEDCRGVERASVTPGKDGRIVERAILRESHNA